MKVTWIISLPVIFADELNLQYDSVGNLITGDGFYREYDGFNHLIRIKSGNSAGSGSGGSMPRRFCSSVTRSGRVTSNGGC